jgi:hypothetical protein
VRALALVAVGVFALAIGGLQTAAQADDAAIPPYNGDMSFPTIVGPADPEEFSWEVTLGDNQELEAIDDQHAEIYYIEGHQPAVQISAEAAHDADGSNVPTTLSVSGASVITLTVHHLAGDPARGGAPFTYPIMAGPGWEGGFQPAIVTEPPGEGDPHGQAAAQPASRVKVRKRKGKIGGRPSTPLAPPTQGKQTTPALVIGRGSLFGEPVEIAGAGWSAPKYFETPGGGQLCVWIEFLADQSTSSMCGPVAQTASGKETVYIESFWEGMGTNGPREAELTGSLAPDVASVRVSFRRRGSQRIFQTNAVVALVSGELQKSLKQPSPFGYFVIKVRGRFVARSLQIRAFDEEGHFVGASDDASWGFIP